MTRQGQVPDPGNATATTLAPLPPLLTVTLRRAEGQRGLGAEHGRTTRTYALTEEDWGPLDTVRIDVNSE